MTPALTLADLAQFTGTTQWYRHGLNRSVLYTDGARHVAEQGAAFWLLDEIAIGQHVRQVARQEFQVWTLSVLPDDTARLVCTNGNETEVFSKFIEFTDFPLREITLWVEYDGLHRVILLPSEH